VHPAAVDEARSDGADRRLRLGRRVLRADRPRDGARFKADQTNNSYIFPGVGALAVGASRVSDGMFMSAALT